MSTVLILGITPELAQQIREHSVGTYPHECCGALLGKDQAAGDNLSGVQTEPGSLRQVHSLFPLVNRRDDSPRNRFMVTAEDVRMAEEAAQKQGLDIVGWYHSHPDHPARPSGYDREHAWPWYSYIIVSVYTGSAVEMTSWRLNDDREEFSPEEIEVGLHAAT